MSDDELRRAIRVLRERAETARHENRTDDAEQIEARLRTAKSELAAKDEFAHVVCNDRLEDAVAALERIVTQELHSGA